MSPILYPAVGFWPASRAGLELETICRGSRSDAPPLLFVHGAYAGAWCWDAHFLAWFARRGRQACAVSLRGHGESADRAHLHGASLEDYVEDVLSVAGRFHRPPVLVGHSMGGLVVQRCLRHMDPAGVVLMASVPPMGLSASAWQLLCQDPGLLWQLWLLQGLGPTQVNLHVAQRLLFSRPVADRQLLAYAGGLQQESQLALLDMSLPAPPPRRRHDVPMLVLGAADDALFPAWMVRATAATHGVKAEILPDMGHGMMLDAGWQRVAARIERWLREQVPCPATSDAAPTAQGWPSSRG
ncbi:alpha/beta hydrolase [Alkalilimnicola ehrlichii MLHE-1]|uniref:Alpha/beta hydrolase fold protein n=1 Tax=Alkalilimnicola ehrlichii (strain ATCC BAA-1101 / DSM 17681 / MLHE-1) TaxID=187272 RepID=Q0A899_ALKEH|nr:alpha/beta fold hydrolase [Alkalilimnicola ehrlichii]ABI56938.1 alpha/beta hydrolase fold protein [Alkalilimnicola ehrlichii MLHE-1]